MLFFGTDGSVASGSLPNTWSSSASSSMSGRGCPRGARLLCSNGRSAPGRLGFPRAADAPPPRPRGSALFSPVISTSSLSTVHKFRLMLDGGGQHGAFVVDDLTYRMVPVGQRCRQRGGLVEDVVDGGASPLEHGDDRGGDAVDLVWVQCQKSGETRRIERRDPYGWACSAGSWHRRRR